MFYDNKAYYFEQDEAPLHYHCEVREFLDDNNFHQPFIGRPPWSSDLTKKYPYGLLNNSTNCTLRFFETYCVWKKAKELTATKARHYKCF